MIQYKQYRIFINYSEHSRLRADYEVRELNRQGQYQKEQTVFNESLKKTDDPLWKEEIDKYEKAIYKMLENIESTDVGKLFFKVLNPKTEIWIVPHTSKDFKKCYCAKTLPLNYDLKPFTGYDKGKGDAYILFNPNEDFQDDTLFHELIHAYRFSYDKFEAQHVFAGGEYNTEEFLAMMMQNIYLSQLGKLQLHFTYHDGFVDRHPAVHGTKEEIYDHLTDDQQFVQVLKFFLAHEYLAMLVAHSLPNVAFNPFRDYANLEKQMLDIMNTGISPKDKIKQFPKYPY